MKLRISKALLLQLQMFLKTDQAIGARFGATRQAVQILRKKHGIGYVRDKHPVRDARILALRLSGLSCTAISEKTGLSSTQVLKVIKKIMSGKAAIETSGAISG